MKRIRTEREAVAYIERVGFCLLFPVKTVTAASLWEAVKGSTAFSGWDEDAERVWHWKDALPQQGLAWYGKLLRRKGTFISPHMLGHFLATRSRDGYERLYRDGLLTREARDIAAWLDEHGAAPAADLRTRFGGKGKARSRADRALEELQTALIVTHFGTADQAAGWPSAVIELVARAFPDAWAAAEKLNPDEALSEILARYRDQAPEAGAREVARLFGMRPDQVTRAGW